jgi:lysozyme
LAHRLIDVSEHQRDVDWGRVRAAGYVGAVVRVADGDHRDAFYTGRRVRALEQAGLTWGPYYYARVASPANGQRGGAREAEMAVGFAREHGWGKKGQLRFAYDFEEANGQPPRKAAKHAVAFVRAYERLTGDLPIFYTMPGFWQQVVGHLDDGERRLIARCPLWIAHWRVARPTVPGPWHDYLLWQHDDRGQAPGVSTPADTNRTRAGLSALMVGGVAGRPTRRALQR